MTNENFTPPYPEPHQSKSSFIKRFIRGWDSWIHVVYKNSYNLKLGEVNLPRTDMFVVGEPNLVTDVFRNKDKLYPKSYQLMKLLEPLMGNSVFTSNGDEWEGQRSMLKNAFGHTHLKRAYGDMLSASNELINIVKKKAAETPEFNIEHYMTHVAADIIYRTMFSESLSEADSKKVFDAFHGFQKSAQKAFILRLYGLPSFFNKRSAKKQAERIRDTFGTYIQPRYEAFQALSDDEKEAYVEKNILDSLLTAKHPTTQQRFTLQEVIDQMGVFFIAGHETTASALSWALYMIAKSPELQESLHQEAKAILDHKEIAPEDIKTLKTFDLVFKETLRLYPPVGFFLREAGCDMSLRSKHIKQGSVVVVSPWLIQRSDNHWKNPHEFDAKRFDTNDSAAQARCPMHDKSHEQAYFPFGKGERICMGAAFAHQESMLVLSKFLYHFKLEPSNSHQPDVVSRVTTRPKNGIFLNIQERNSTA
ncbi:MAG: cytochrome P450 [Pseudomonadota bacterium]